MTQQLREAVAEADREAAAQRVHRLQQSQRMQAALDMLTGQVSGLRDAKLELVSQLAAVNEAAVVKKAQHDTAPAAVKEAGAVAAVQLQRDLAAAQATISNYKEGHAAAAAAAELAAKKHVTDLATLRAAAAEELADSRAENARLEGQLVVALAGQQAQQAKHNPELQRRLSEMQATETLGVSATATEEVAPASEEAALQLQNKSLPNGSVTAGATRHTHSEGAALRTVEKISAAQEVVLAKQVLVDARNSGLAPPQQVAAVSQLPKELQQQQSAEDTTVVRSATAAAAMAAMFESKDKGQAAEGETQQADDGGDFAQPVKMHVATLVHDVHTGRQHMPAQTAPTSFQTGKPYAASTACLLHN